MSASPTSTAASPATAGAADAAAAAVEAISSAAGQEAIFSMQLNQDQRDSRDWVHGYAADAVRTTAKFDEAANEWVLNGQKAWATNGGIADVHVVIASVDRELAARGHAAFVVPMSETKGITQGTKVSKHGLRASHTADVFLDDCRVPAGHVLGGKEKLDERLARVREGQRSKSQAAMQTFESSRPTVAAQALGIGRAAYAYALDY